MKQLLFVLLVGLSTSIWASKPVNINKADAKMISESLEGIGMVKAQKIVDYRKTFKVSFKSLKDLEKIKGLGEKTLKDNAEYIRFDPPIIFFK